MSSFISTVSIILLLAFVVPLTLAPIYYFFPFPNCIPEGTSFISFTNLGVYNGITLACHGVNYAYFDVTAFLIIFTVIIFVLIAEYFDYPPAIAFVSFMSIFILSYLNYLYKLPYYNIIKYIPYLLILLAIVYSLRR